MKLHIQALNYISGDDKLRKGLQRHPFVVSFFRTREQKI